MRYWLSFAEGRALGIVLTEAESPEAAIRHVREIGQNPGGEVLCIEFPPGDIARDVEWNRFEKDKLYTEQDIKAMHYGYKRINELPQAAADRVMGRIRNEDGFHKICKECNE